MISHSLLFSTAQHSNNEEGEREERENHMKKCMGQKRLERRAALSWSLHYRLQPFCTTGCLFVSFAFCSPPALLPPLLFQTMPQSPTVKEAHLSFLLDRATGVKIRKKERGWRRRGHECRHT
mmetsp:Transcript_45285/g.89241  ORF Transcript_45285/g.89241 Transcript_45285/m.89241 type:complete len:122 (-) Transcript_45285:394-759(-)